MDILDGLDGLRDTVRGYTQQWASDFDQSTKQATMRSRQYEDDQQRKLDSAAAFSPVIMSGFKDRLQQSFGLRANAYPGQMPPAERLDNQDLPWGL